MLEITINSRLPLYKSSVARYNVKKKTNTEEINMKQKRKLSPRFLIALTVFSLMGQIAWVVENMYFNVFIYEMFHATPSDISAMVMPSSSTKKMGS